MLKDRMPDRISLSLSTLWEQLFPKVKDAYAIPKVVDRIEYWVSQQPTLTTILCNYVLKYASQINLEDAEGIVDRIVQDEILNDCKSSEVAAHIDQIASAIADYTNPDLLLLLYLKILQRGSVPASKGPEQETLIRLGLVTEQNEKLVVANRLYARIFDIEWIEQQLPGITRPVAVIESAHSKSRQSKASTRLYSRLAVVAFGLVAVGIGIAAYVKATTSQAALATQETSEAIAPISGSVSEAPAEDALRTERNQADSTSADKSSADGTSADGTLADRSLYDAGVEHATNGRWLLMAREFCSLSEESAYFWPAEKQLERWLKLYPEEIAIAQDTFTKETGESCPVSMKAVEQTGAEL